MACRYFLACFTLTSCLVAEQSQEYALKGGKVSLKPNIAGHPDGILWKHHGNKVVEFNGNEEHVYSPYDNRVTLDWVSAQLSITNLRFEDSGEYELEVDVNKGLHRSLHELEVIDKVAEPTISCEMSGSNSSAKLECSSEPQSLTKFSWKIGIHSMPGPELKISLGDKHDDEVYICDVGNPLSQATATFTAKDCYPDKGSSVALIASLVTILLVVLLLVGLGILFCKLRHKACFAPSDTTKESDMEKAQGDVNECLLNRQITLPSTQPLRQCAQAYDMKHQDENPRIGHVKSMKKMFERLTPLRQLQTENNTDEHNRTASPPSPQPRESPSSLDQNNPPSNDNGDADADQHRESAEEVPHYDLSDSERSNDPEPDGVSEPEKEADEDEKPASSETSPPAQPHSPMTKSSPNMAPEDTAGEHEEDADSDQVTDETEEKNARESDSPVEGEETEPEDSSKGVPELRGSDTLLHDKNVSQEETNTNEENQQETVKTVSEDEDDTDKKEEDLYSAQQPQSPTKPDNENADTSQESVHAAHADPDREETSHDSDESDKGEGETVEGKNEVQCGLKEEKPVNKSLSEDKEGQKKDEAGV